VEAVRCLEDDSLFNAGRGAVLNANGRAELDASIMRGRDRQAGAVAALQRLRNPIQAAEAVLKYAPHVMLAGPAADRWGAAQGLDTVPNAYFITQRMRKYWRRRTAAESGQSKGTVGAVALDRQGDLAAATSTGGRMLKTPGRVGDSPLIGSGTYASKLCAVSATGAGEYFIRTNVAYQVHARMAYAGASLSAAADSAVFGPMARLGGDGGIIALSGKGLMATPFNTGGMLRSFRFSDGREGFAVYP
jgi:beta-aspartyl-peptidase (threonine type)